MSFTSISVSSTYTAKYRDGQGVVNEVATGCRSKDAAKAVLKDLVDRAEKVKAKILSPAEDLVSEHQATLLSAHIDDYVAYLMPRANKGRVKSTKSRLTECATACKWTILGDMTADGLQAYLDSRIADGMSHGSANARIEVWRA